MIPYIWYPSDHSTRRALLQSVTHCRWRRQENLDGRRTNTLCLHPSRAKTAPVCADFVTLLLKATHNTGFCGIINLEKSNDVRWEKKNCTVHVIIWWLWSERESDFKTCADRTYHLLWFHWDLFHHIYYPLGEVLQKMLKKGRRRWTNQSHFKVKGCRGTTSIFYQPIMCNR